MPSASVLCIIARCRSSLFFPCSLSPFQSALLCSNLICSPITQRPSQGPTQKFIQHSLQTPSLPYTMNHYPRAGNHVTGTYSQHAPQEIDLFAVHGTGAITSNDVVGYYGPVVEVLDDFSEPLYDLLPQNPYQGGVVAVAQLAPPLEFGGLRLGSALRDDMRDLPTHSQLAFPGFVKLSQKMSVRIHVKYRLPFEHQATVLRRNNTGPTMGQLAMIIAREVNRFMDRERAIRNPLTHLGRELNIDDLVLVQVRHVSRGSIQPVLGVLRQRTFNTE